MTATTVQNLGNTDEVLEAVGEFQTERVATALTAREGQEVREYVQSATDPENVIVEVDGDKVSCEPVGLGKRARLSRNLVRAEQDGDDLAELDAILDVIDLLDDRSPERFDQEYWDELTYPQVKGAFQQLAQKSAGGPRAGK